MRPIFHIVVSLTTVNRRQPDYDLTHARSLHDHHRPHRCRRQSGPPRRRAAARPHGPGGRRPDHPASRGRRRPGRPWGERADGRLRRARHAGHRLRRRGPAADHLRRHRGATAGGPALAAVAAAKDAGVGHVFYTSVTEPTVDNPAGVVPDHLVDRGGAGRQRTALDQPPEQPVRRVPAPDPAAGRGQRSARHQRRRGADRLRHPDRLRRRSRRRTAAARARPDLRHHRADRSLHPGPRRARRHPGRQPGRGGRRHRRGATSTGLVAAGLPEPVAQLLASFGTATREGFMAQTSTAVADLTGQQPTPLAALVR